MINYGKEFEQDFKASINTLERMWLYRPSDFGGGQSARFTNHSLCDYIIFNDNMGKLFLLELKSVQGKSISCPSADLYEEINTMEQTASSKEEKKELKEMLRKGNTYKIKYHQIKDLKNIEECNNYNNIKTYIIINFRDYNKTFCCKPSTLIDILQQTKKSSVNINELENAGCYIIKQEGIRKTRHQTYQIEDILYDKIN